MSYRFPDPNPVLISLLGTESAADGTLQFYDYQTTTPKATYSDRGLTTPNANPVELDASGRAETEIWLDGEYTAVLRAADTTVIWTRDIVPEVAPGTALPDPTDLPGGTVQSNGVGYELVDVMALPDPTDSADYMVIVNADGTGYSLQPQPAEPEIPEPDITISTATAVIGGGSGSRLAFEVKTATIPAAASRTSTVNVTFATNFTSLWAVVPISHTYNVGSFGIGATVTSEGYTPLAAGNSATIRANSCDDGGDSGYEIDNAISVTVLAVGLVAAA